MKDQQSTTVRVHGVTKCLVDELETKINKERKRKKMGPINKVRIFEIAVRNMTVEMGVES